MNSRERFLHLCGRNGITTVAAFRAWSALHTRYTESHRHYHNLRHIESMLFEMDQVSPGDTAMELAIWYHDVIYDPKARDNEEQSATFFETGIGHNIDRNLSGNVVRLILATDYARPRSGKPDEDLLRDIDLSILASPVENYAAYTLAVREEYTHVTDEDFLKGRRAVMERFLEGRIFHTESFAAEESRARENIRAEIASLAE